MGDLPLQVGEIDHIKIHQPDPADAGGGEVHADRRPQAARADAQNAGALEFLLTGHPDLGKDQVAGVAANFVVA